MYTLVNLNFTIQKWDAKGFKLHGHDILVHLLFDHECDICLVRRAKSTLGHGAALEGGLNYTHMLS